ncbi:hypothetical protein QBC35DRAFT_39049 [Podospora australis]|uniref:Uncharacterized protein n=1 Tax=Podospora australis TaxID=1536484 RepID=A0AAN6WML7_9PEZI|nr:hypothetical protein QBC35DRAFT_39049 [Podospora australis]
MIEYSEGIIANAVLNGITILPLIAILALSWRSIRHHSQPVKMAQAFLRAAVPVMLLATLILTAQAALLAAESNRPYMRLDVSRAAIYLSLTGYFIEYAGAILGTLALYLATTSAYYVVIGRLRWWRLIRIDAIVGGILLFAFDIAWYAKRVSDIEQDRVFPTYGLQWLPIIIDITLVVISLIIVSFAAYVFGPLKRRSELPVGHIPLFLLVASSFWLMRCTYMLAVDIKTVNEDWTYGESMAQIIYDPIFDRWASVVVLALLALLLRKPLWSDPAVLLDASAHQALSQPYYPQPQYQQQPVYQQQPHVQQQQPVYDPRFQQQVYYDGAIR